VGVVVGRVEEGEVQEAAGAASFGEISMFGRREVQVEETGSAQISEDATKISELGRRSRSRSSVIGLGLEKCFALRLCPLAPLYLG